MQCKKCGNIIDNNTAFCPNCGEKVIRESIKTEKESNKKIIPIIIAIILIIISFVLGFIIGKYQKDKYIIEDKNVLENNENDKNDDKKTTTKDKEQDYTFNLFDVSKIEKIPGNTSELTNSIKINELFFNPKSSTYGKYRNVYIYGKNNNSQMVYVRITFEYYDSEGYKIEEQIAYSNVYGNSEFVLHGYVLDDSIGYSKVKMKYEASKIKSYEKEIKQKDLATNVVKLNDGGIVLNITNNDSNVNNKDDYVFIYASCIYFKDGKPVFATNGSQNRIYYGEIGEIKFYQHELKLNNDYKNPKQIDFDDYKIIIYGAYTSNSKSY